MVPASSSFPVLGAAAGTIGDADLPTEVGFVPGGRSKETRSIGMRSGNEKVATLCGHAAQCSWLSRQSYTGIAPLD